MNLASMLRKIVLPDNMAPQLFPQIFLGADTEICGKNVLGGLAILCVRNGMLSARKIVPHYLADPGILYVKPQVHLHRDVVRFPPHQLLRTRTTKDVTRWIRQGTVWTLWEKPGEPG